MARNVIIFVYAVNNYLMAQCEINISYCIVSTGGETVIDGESCDVRCMVLAPKIGTNGEFGNFFVASHIPLQTSAGTG